MKCIISGCGADSTDQLGQPKIEEMNCQGNGATTGPEGLWCIAGWLRDWSGMYPHYDEFLQAKPWEGPNR